MTKKCLHHWICEMPNGPNTKAKCKKCKKNTVFVYDESKMKTRRTNPVTGASSDVYDIVVGKGVFYR
tara:strand:+ start:6056 stop:6256 length:201 start_codon:yes stop_codon:yes gene_type:complete